VCNLLKSEELDSYFAAHPPGPARAKASPGVLGTLYEIPAASREQALEELDVREKGGYEREFVQCYLIRELPEGGRELPGGGHELRPVTALLYRGGVASDELSRRHGVAEDKHNFWPRVLYDVPSFAASVQASAVGPSGPNIVYLRQLAEWMALQAGKFPFLNVKDDTIELYERASELVELAGPGRDERDRLSLLFLSVLGNNEQRQLGVPNPDPAGPVPRPFDARKPDQIPGLWETSLPLLGAGAGPSDPPGSVPRPRPQFLGAGGSHSGAIVGDCRCYLWGSDAEGQCGSREEGGGGGGKVPLPHAVPALRPLQLRAKLLALGHAHTVVATPDCELRCFGSDTHGQCAVPAGLAALLGGGGATIASVAAGVRTTACILDSGAAYVFGDAKHLQSRSDAPYLHPAGAKFVAASLGLRHTLLLDDQGDVYAFGDNRVGQLGLPASREPLGVPNKVLLGERRRAISVSAGWCHAAVLCEGGAVVAWGRNDKGQLGLGHNENKMGPSLVKWGGGEGVAAQVRCAPENTVILTDDGRVLGTGWGEHGNLGTGDCEDRNEFVEAVVEASIRREGEFLLAVGGAHVLIA
jgi:alpha-tubulin suppressor-like RCC1 family protein